MDTPAPITTTHYLYFAAGGSVEIRRQHDTLDAALQFAKLHARVHSDTVRVCGADGTFYVTPDGQTVTGEQLAARVKARLQGKY